MKLALRFVLLAAALAAGQGCSRADAASGGETLTLVAVAPANAIAFQTEWCQLEKYEHLGPPFHKAPGVLDLNIRWVCDDAHCMSPDEISRLLATLPPAAPGSYVPAPSDDSLVMRWDPRTTVVEFILASGSNGPPSTACLSWIEKPWPMELNRARWEYPPQYKDYFVAKVDPATSEAVNEPAGPGYLHVRTDGAATFAPGGPTAPGGNASKLLVGSDRDGRLWFWFAP